VDFANSAYASINRGPAHANLGCWPHVLFAPQAAIPAKLACDQTKRVPDPLGEPRCRSLHSRHRFAAADPGLLIRRAFPGFRAVKSSILERNSLRIGEVFALL
jgi:hypothetical protein